MIQKPVVPSSIADRKVPWGPLGRQVFQRTYSHNFEDGTKESWQQTIVRAVDGNLGLVSPRFIEEGEREKLLDLLFDFSIIPGGRHLYASGIQGRQYLQNCHVSGFSDKDPTQHFTFLFDQLMMGGGVGTNYSNRYIEKIPKVGSSVDLHVICDPSHPDIAEFDGMLSKHVSDKGDVDAYKVEDSREGWTDSLGHMLRHVFDVIHEGTETVVVIDVSGIRRRGSPLKTSGGIACGPGPLVQMLTNVSKVINGAVGAFLTSLDVMLIDHALADCVVAGGKRRSSRMAVKNWGDHDIFEFINCKQVDGTHWTTNISVEIDEEFFTKYKYNDKRAKDVARQVVLGMRSNGEPGFWNRSRSQLGERHAELIYCPNPCSEIMLYMWESCNLGNVNLGAFATRPLADLLEASRLISRWLIRATYGDTPHQCQRDVVDQNRRIGVGLMGFHEYIALRGVKYSKSHDDPALRTTLFAMKSTVCAESSIYALQLGIPEPVKHTCVAPTGTTAMLPGTTSGIQCMMSPWFKRLVRYSSDDPELAIKKSDGYQTFPDEDAKNTEIVIYWCEDPIVAKVRAAGWDPSKVLESQSQIKFEDSLRVQTMFQECFADNAVSFTINLEPDLMPSEEAMESTLMEHLHRLKGTTVFPNKSRKNNPIQPITKEEFDSYTGPKETYQVEDVCKGACPIK